MLPSWLKFSKGPTANMSKNGSDRASNPTISGNMEGQREMSCYDASDGKDKQGLSRSANRQEESMLHEPVVITKPENSYPRGRQASGQSNAKDPPMTSPQRGNGHFKQDRKYSEAVKGLKQQELKYARSEKEEVKLNTKNAGLLTGLAHPGDLQKRLEESERQIVRLSKELDHGRREKKDLENKVAEAQREVHDLRKKCDQTEEESRRKSKETESLKKDVDKAQRQIKDYLSEIEATHRQLHEEAVYRERQDLALQAAGEQLQRAETVHGVERKQLMERMAELQSAQVFLDAADSLSGADIISMTAVLNAEILQIGALMADSLDYTRRQRETPKEMLEKQIGKILIQALIDQMSVDEEDVDPTMVQLALQVCLVRCSHAIMTSWTLGGDNDEQLSAIYSRIWNEEKQSVAGRWRSMTQMHAVGVDGARRALHMIIRAVEQVLIAASTNYHPSINQFQERLSTINNLALQLRSSIGQHITSLEICPIMVEPGLPFDPSQMDDTYARERKTNSTIVEVNERVAGSTELGLISRIKDNKGKVETRIMLKPKVVLCSALTEDS